jgi:hypothetical protein
VKPSRKTILQVPVQLLKAIAAVAERKDTLAKKTWSHRIILATPLAILFLALNAEAAVKT